MDSPQIGSMFPTNDGKLAFELAIPVVGCHGIVIAVSLHPDFPEAQRHMFILPPVTQCTLDVGKGTWWVRVGGCEGSKEAGKVKWSGVFGPVLVESAKAPPALQPSPLKPMLTQPLQNGFRVFAEHSLRHGFLVEVCSEKEGGSKFPVGSTRWTYGFDTGIGWIDCKGMTYPDLYSIRISAFEMPPIENHAYPLKDTFPTKQVFQVMKGISFHRKTAAKVKLHQIRITNAVDSLFIEQRKANPNMKFASHTDYLRYLAAQERMGDTKHAI